MTNQEKPPYDINLLLIQALSWIESAREIIKDGIDFDPIDDEDCGFFIEKLKKASSFKYHVKSDLCKTDD
jgi:hypothetical protein